MNVRDDLICRIHQLSNVENKSISHIVLGVEFKEKLNEWIVKYGNGGLFKLKDTGYIYDKPYVVSKDVVGYELYSDKICLYGGKKDE